MILNVGGDFCNDGGRTCNGKKVLLSSHEKAIEWYFNNQIFIKQIRFSDLVGISYGTMALKSIDFLPIVPWKMAMKSFRTFYIVLHMY